jgi:hypothetical protein
MICYLNFHIYILYLNFYLIKVCNKLFVCVNYVIFVLHKHICIAI